MSDFHFPKVPYGFSKTLGRIVSIEEVGSGRNNLFCLGCDMELVGRICKGERQNHFAHYSKDNKKEGAKTTCTYSYWVSVRDMAKQILKEASSICIPSITNFTCKNMPVYSTKKQSQYDMKLKSLYFSFDIYLETPEEDEDRIKIHFPDMSDFYPRLILNINLGKIPANQIANPDALAKHILHNMDLRRWVIPPCSFVKKVVESTGPVVKTNTQKQSMLLHVSSQTTEIQKRKEEEKEITSSPEVRRANVLSSLKYTSIPLASFSKKDLDTCARMPLYFDFVKGKFEYAQKQNKRVYIFHTGNNLYGACVNNEIMCFALLNEEYVIYKGIDEVDVSVFGVTRSIDEAIEFLEKGLHLKEAYYMLLRRAEERLLFFQKDRTTQDFCLDEVVFVQEEENIQIGIYGAYHFALVTFENKKGLYILAQDDELAHMGDVKTTQDIKDTIHYLVAIKKEAEDLF